MGKLIGLALLVLVGFAIYGMATRNLGEVITEDREVASFDHIRLEGIGTIRVRQGDRVSLKVEGQEGILKYVHTKIEKGRLKIYYDSGWLPFIVPTKPLRYIIEVPRLKRVHIAGAGRLEADGIRTKDLDLSMSGAASGRIKDLSADALKIGISGAGSFRTDGSVDEQLVEISGAGSYRGLKLRTRDSEISISGAGKADVWATRDLVIDISGAGKVDYKGDPEVEQDISGTGNVKKVR